jgi:hypothetical protein
LIIAATEGLQTRTNIAAEIVEDLKAAFSQFAMIAADLKK